MEPIKKCPYCGKDVLFADSKVIYGKSYGMVYICLGFPYCDSYVGVHNKTNIPKGTLANKELRTYRSLTHQYFDPLWKFKKFKNRLAAYEWLAGEMNIKIHKCHIGYFNLEQCKKAIEVSKPLTQELLNKKINS